MTDLDRTLTQLEKQDWGPPAYGSHLVTTCHQLRHKPLKEFTAEDLRIMIGQNFSLEFLVPMTIERLEADPLEEGDLYPGDLLRNVLSLESLYWKEHPDFRRRCAALVQRVPALMDERAESEVVRKAFQEGLQKFQGALDLKK